MSFAQPLKNMLREILSPEAFYQENKEDSSYGICGRSPRDLMQTLGTEWGRKQVADDIWIEVMRRHLVSTNWKTVIVDDIRFNSEADMLKDLDGEIYLIKREGYSYTHEHDSEKPIDESYLSGVIVNSSLVELVKIINNLEELVEIINNPERSW